ncbi:MAG: energy transducer TonB [Gemmatimonadales bacterium]
MRTTRAPPRDCIDRQVHSTGDIMLEGIPVVRRRSLAQPALALAVHGVVIAVMLQTTPAPPPPRPEPVSRRSVVWTPVVSTVHRAGSGKTGGAILQPALPPPLHRAPGLAPLGTGGIPAPGDLLPGVPIDGGSGALAGQPDSVLPGILTEDPGTEPPVLVAEFRPEYPGLLRRAGVPGHVQVEYVVGISGEVEAGSARILASSDTLFSQAVLRGLRMARFRPARRGGRAVRVLVRQAFRFEPSGR